MKTTPRLVGMRAVLLTAVLLTGCATAMANGHTEGGTIVRQTMPFDSDWRFLKGDAPGAEQPGFDDTEWRPIAVPHDWSIEGPFAETNKTGGAGGFLPAGVGWYRKSFTLPLDIDRQHIHVEFDGVMANSDVWINGHHLGKRPYGYVSFGYEMTDYLNFGSKLNVIAVRTDTSEQPASRWYSGAGIYRHVRLVVTDATRIARWGIFVTTPEVAADHALVRVQNTVTNGGNVGRLVTLQLQLSDPAGKIIETAETPAQMVPARQSLDIVQDFTVNQPQRWDLQRPVLYRVSATVRYNDRSFDDDAVSFGIREAKFDAASGFSLNGQTLKLYGVCLHHDGSAFGAAVPLAVWERRLIALKALGVNAVRTAHNPPAPEFLDLCDRMGVLVMDEFFDCWTVRKNPYDYHRDFNKWSKIDAYDTILRDRNHPSVILYSVGNEIHDTPRADLAKKILTGLVEVCHAADPTRPVTQALFRPNVSGDYTNGLADLLDVIGTNYRDNELLAAQREKPERKIVGTEQRHDRQTWLWLRDNPSHAGQFLWSGVDYLGESRRWPVIAAGSGLLDRTATPKPLAYQRQSWWSGKPMVFIARRVDRTDDSAADPGFAPLDRRQVLFADWTPRDTSAHEENVEVYSNCEEVELFLNGKSLGAQVRPDDASPRNWRVAFAAGRLKAVGRNSHKNVATQELRTAGAPKKVVLQTDSEKLAPVWDDVAYVTATVLDKNGVVVPDAEHLITFSASGPGAVAAVDSGDNASQESFQASERKAYQGRCFAIVRASGSSGRIKVTASAPGLTGGSISLKATRSPTN